MIFILGKSVFPNKSGIMDVVEPHHLKKNRISIVQYAKNKHNRGDVASCQWTACSLPSHQPPATSHSITHAAFFSDIVPGLFCRFEIGRAHV
jgi:hypothetical protein